ncbi:DNA-processing protein DprA [Pseudoalteromonas shioyasakiensis]|uniref:DNA-processing protein DprA n=1 Tax=Pseudoalteromonas shioyasakiensis TaxID=1190813 RepID=UPI002119AD48|nr:DNA-processing protein DprA [Pseudoalteromonas shioyasakiensis]MCQ8880083.1 DNA-processing protein DprA [Pseudoalteromonas shioyasakiensis]
MEQSYGKLTHWLAFYLCKGLGVKTLLALAQKLPLADIFTLSHEQLLAMGLNQQVATNLCAIDWAQVKQYETLINQADIQVISYFDTHYPPLLKEIASAPLLLFCRGNSELLLSPQIAIVGSRNATPIGLEIAAQFAHQLTAAGFTVTSGMALGIDGAAHKGALAGTGNTIAVLGTGVDIYYPKRHRLLTEQVLKSGLLVSEFLPGTAANANNFPRRNRIISGLSLGVLIVEAEIKSGSLITVRYALEQNKEVFAVPGSIKNPLSQASHFLIKQGAKLVENVSDILEEVSFFNENSLYNIEEPIENESECIVLKSVGFEVTPVDVIARRCELPIDKVQTRLLDLELDDKVERVLDGYIKLGAT